MATQRNHAHPRGRLRGLRGLGDDAPVGMTNGPFTAIRTQTSLAAQQAVVDQNPLDYSSPAYAIAAGLDPDTVVITWAKALAAYPTQAAAVNAGIMPAVVTQLWAQSRKYVPAPAGPDYAPLVAIGSVVLILMALHVGDSSKGGEA
jgi:hypothetical protein